MGGRASAASARAVAIWGRRTLPRAPLNMLTSVPTAATATAHPSAGSAITRSVRHVRVRSTAARSPQTKNEVCATT